MDNFTAALNKMNELFGRDYQSACLMSRYTSDDI